jgi:hypothetical protein
MSLFFIIAILASLRVPGGLVGVVGVVFRIFVEEWGFL